MNPPTQYPFAPILWSKDPLGLYRDAIVGTGALGASQKYQFPRLAADYTARIHQFVTAGGVVDPLNLVFWGDADRNTIQDVVTKLPWGETILSSNQWAVSEVSGAQQALPTIYSIQPGHAASLRRPWAVLTLIVGALARHHARIFDSFQPTKEWGHITMVGAHTERIKMRSEPPFFWHTIQDWHEARNKLAGDLERIVGRGAFSPIQLRTDGVIQGRDFDGWVIFVKV